MLYRSYTPQDFPALYAIEEACFEPSLRFSRAYLRQLVLASQAATWVAEQQNGPIAGFAIVEWARDDGSIVAYIETLEVIQELRGRGIGAELLHRVESSARAAGAVVLWLHADAENAPALRLYQAQGFLCEGREENYYAQGHTALIYAKMLESLPPDQ
jgi:ribosomal protein S18 acetylase RimI-like enzyme